MLKIVPNEASLLLQAGQTLSKLRQALTSLGTVGRRVGSPDGYTQGTELCDVSVLAPLICVFAQSEDVSDASGSVTVAPAIAVVWARDLVSEMARVSFRVVCGHNITVSEKALPP